MQPLSKSFLLGIVFVGAAASASGCASSSKEARVLKTESGRLTSVGAAEDEPHATIAAIDQADKYCGKKKQEAVFEEEALSGGKNEKSKSALNLESIPVIGKVLKADDQTQVTLEFRCKKPS